MNTDQDEVKVINLFQLLLICFILACVAFVLWKWDSIGQFLNEASDALNRWYDERP